MEHVGREAPQFPFSVKTDEVVTTLEEVPSMVELDAPEFWELVFLFPRSESLVDGGRRKNRSHGNSTRMGECEVTYGTRYLQKARSSHVDREVDTKQRAIDS